MVEWVLVILGLVVFASGLGFLMDSWQVAVGWFAVLFGVWLVLVALATAVNNQNDKEKTQGQTDR